jgi:hypothetical protein
VDVVVLSLLARIRVSRRRGERERGTEVGRTGGGERWK